MMGNKRKMTLLKLLSLLQAVVSLSGILVTALILGVGIDSNLAPLWALIMASVLTILSTCIHEGGHYLGAKWSNMTVFAVRIASVEMLPQRRGWRVRWSPQPKRSRLGGYVMVAADPYQPMRRQFIVLTAMGPLANLVIGFLCISVGLLSGEVIRMILLAIGASNVAMGLANLIPTYTSGASDGAALIAWCRCKEAQTPTLAYARLLALSVAGILSDELPEDDIALLSSEPMPAPLISIWYRLNARQIRGDWQGAVQLSDELHALLDISSISLDSMTLLVSIMQIELGFCRAILLKAAVELREDLWTHEIDWCCPALRLRCCALRKFLEGNALTGEEYLDRALALALNSPDLSLGKSESRLAAHIRLLGTGPTLLSTEGKLQITDKGTQKRDWG